RLKRGTSQVLSMRLRRMIRGTGRARTNPPRPAFDPCRSHHGSVAQLAELPPLKRRVAGSTPAGATHGRTATGAVSRLENGWVSQPWGFDSPSFRLCGGMAELARQRVATRVDGASRSQVRVLLPALLPFRRGRVGKTR